MKASWADPMTSETVAIGTRANTGVESFATPNGWEEALLILESVDCASPGERTHTLLTDRAHPGGRERRVFRTKLRCSMVLRRLTNWGRCLHTGRSISSVAGRGLAGRVA